MRSTLKSHSLMAGATLEQQCTGMHILAALIICIARDLQYNQIGMGRNEEGIELEKILLGEYKLQSPFYVLHPKIIGSQGRSTIHGVNDLRQLEIARKIFHCKVSIIYH